MYFNLYIYLQYAELKLLNELHFMKQIRRNSNIPHYIQ